MEYVVRVIGYNSFWTADKTPGKLWTTDIDEAYKFQKEIDAINVIYTGRNMEVVEYHSAKEDILPQPIDWKKLEEKAESISKFNDENQLKVIETQGVALEPEDFHEVIA